VKFSEDQHAEVRWKSGTREMFLFFSLRLVLLPCCGKCVRGAAYRPAAHATTRYFAFVFCFFLFSFCLPSLWILCFISGRGRNSMLSGSDTSWSGQSSRHDENPSSPALMREQVCVCYWEVGVGGVGGLLLFQHAA
jgi:hypothetical protein